MINGQCTNIKIVVLFFEKFLPIPLGDASLPRSDHHMEPKLDACPTLSGGGFHGEDVPVDT